MTLCELRLFCSNDPWRYNIQLPWTEGHWSFATDAKIIVIVPKLAGAIVTNVNPPNGMEFIDRILSQNFASYVPFGKAITGANIRCEFCRVTCPECKGYGCVDCSGNGWKTSNEPCDVCRNKREILSYKCGAAHINPYVIRHLVSQPNLQFIPNDNNNIPTTFRFCGGYAAVMPIKVRDES